MVETYQQSVQKRVVYTLFQSQVPTTSSTIASEIGSSRATVSAVLSVLSRVPELKEVIEVDKSQKIWTYYMKYKSLSVDDIMEALRKQQKKSNIKKNVTKSTKPGKLETEKDTILVDKVTFSRGTAIRLTGDIIIAGIDVFLDIVAEIVKGKEEK